MAWAYRASSYANNGAGTAIVSSPGTTTVTLGAALTAGDLIVLSIMGFNTQSSGNTPPTFAVSDSVNGSWGSGEVKTLTWFTAGRGSLWAFANSGAGTPVITLTATFNQGSSSPCNVGLQVAAFSGIATTSAFDTGAAASGTANTANSGAVSPATAAGSELMVGCYVDSGEGTTLSVGNINSVAATLTGKHDADGGRWQGLFEHGDAGSSGGTPSATASTTGTLVGGWAMIGGVFKLAAGAAQDTPELRLPARRQMHQLLAI